MKKEELLKNFLNHQKIFNSKSEHTVKAYSLDISQFLNFLEDEIKNVQLSHLRSFLSYLSLKGIAQRSINRKLSSLKTFFEFLAYQGFIKKDPTLLLKGPKFSKPLPEILSIEEIDNIISVIKEDSFQDLRNKSIIYLLYSSGLRAAELISLKENDISFSREELRIIGKGNVERIAFFDKKAKSILLKYLPLKKKLFKSEYIFINKFGEQLSDRYLRKTINELTKKAKISKKVSPHTFRHSFATLLLNKGVSLKAIQELLGHASISSTQVYTHVSKEELRKCYIKYGPFMDGK